MTFIIGTHDYVRPNFPLFTVYFLGCATFVSGMLINVDSDRRLRLLRASREAGPRDKGYKIPRGGFFEWVSAANYFGEILEWIGFAIAARNPAAVFFATFTLSFLAPRGCHHHK